MVLDTAVEVVLMVLDREVEAVRHLALMVFLVIMGSEEAMAEEAMASVEMAVVV